MCAVVGRRGRGQLEREVLELLWQCGDASVTVAEVQAALGSGLAYTTVMTILVRLQNKGAVVRQPRGRAFVYRAATDHAGVTAARMHDVLDADSDRRTVLMRFVDALDEDDEQALRQLLTDHPHTDHPHTDHPQAGRPRPTGDDTSTPVRED